MISVITTTAIALLSPTIDFFGEVSFSQFFSFDEWAPTQADPSFGVLLIVIGTLSTSSGRCSSRCRSACSARST